MDASTGVITGYSNSFSRSERVELEVGQTIYLCTGHHRIAASSVLPARMDNRFIYVNDGKEFKYRVNGTRVNP